MQILQIMTARHWYVLYKDETKELLEPLSGWALCEDEDGHNVVVGLDAADTVEICEDMDNFVGYRYLPNGVQDGQKKTQL